MQRQSIFITAILSLFVLAGWIGYSLLGNMQLPTRNVQTTSQTTTQSQVKKAKKETGSANVKQASSISTGFAYDGWKIDNGSDQPKACINFTQELDSNDGLKIIDYIRTEPKAKLNR